MQATDPSIPSAPDPSHTRGFKETDKAAEYLVKEPARASQRRGQDDQEDHERANCLVAESRHGNAVRRKPKASGHEAGQCDRGENSGAISSGDACNARDRDLPEGKRPP